MRTVFFMIAFVATSAYTDGQAEYKYREGIMQSIRGQMAAIGAIMRGQVHLENLALHARATSDLAQIVPTVFPEGSGVEKSEALPVIWNDPDAFRVKTDYFLKVTKELADAIESDGDVASAYRNVQRSCKGCHDDFRED